MRIPPFTRIIFEDFSKEVQSWIGKLVEPINSFMLTMRNGLNKGITVNDNMAGAVKSLSVSGNSIRFAYDGIPKAVILGSWQDVTLSSWTPPTGGISLSWIYGDGNITCTFYGTNSAHTYNITLLILND